MCCKIISQITNVTVYGKQALVTRRGSIELSGADQELVVADLPTTLKPDSVRVKRQGTTPVQILAVRTDRVFATESITPKVADLESQVKDLQEQKRGLIDRKATIQLQHQFVESFSLSAVSKFSRSLAQQETGLTEIEALLNFLGQQHGNYSTSITELIQEEQALDEQIAVLRQQLKQWQNTSPHQSFSIFVKVSAEAAGQFELEVSYMVNKASWKPMYDLQVETKQQRLTLNYLAEVEQNTGEDWQDVALELSTAKPGLGTLPPKLQPWYIDLQSSPIERARWKQGIARSLLASRAASEYEYDDAYDDSDYVEVDLDSDPAGSPSLPLARKLSLNQGDGESYSQPKAKSAKNVIAKAERTGSVTTFQVGGNSNIPSDGNPHTVTLVQDEYPAPLGYIAIPSLVNFAYLQTTVTNPADKVTLLPGKANIFRDNTFVGTTQLSNIAPGQQFDVNLGIEEGVTIERELVERQVDKKLLSLDNKRCMTFAYRLQITNLLSQSIPLKLTEQLPISRNEKLKVRLNQTTPKIGVKDLGLLIWELNLPPLGKQQIDYQFVVEYPSDQTTTGLDI